MKKLVMKFMYGRLMSALEDFEMYLEDWNIIRTTDNTLGEEKAWAKVEQANKRIIELSKKIKELEIRFGYSKKEVEVQ